MYVLGRTLGEYLSNLLEMFLWLEKAGLKPKPSKCKLGQFLGYVVSAQGISTDLRKVTTIEEFPQPVDLKSLHAFWA